MKYSIVKSLVVSMQWINKIFIVIGMSYDSSCVWHLSYIACYAIIILNIFFIFIYKLIKLLSINLRMKDVYYYYNDNLQCIYKYNLYWKLYHNKKTIQSLLL